MTPPPPPAIIGSRLTQDTGSAVSPPGVNVIKLFLIITDTAAAKKLACLSVSSFLGWLIFCEYGWSLAKWSALRCPNVMFGIYLTCKH